MDIRTISSTLEVDVSLADPRCTVVLSKTMSVRGIFWTIVQFLDGWFDGVAKRPVDSMEGTGDGPLKHIVNEAVVELGPASM